MERNNRAKEIENYIKQHKGNVGFNDIVTQLINGGATTQEIHQAVNNLGLKLELKRKYHVRAILMGILVLVVGFCFFTSLILLEYTNRPDDDNSITPTEISALREGMEPTADYSDEEVVENLRTLHSRAPNIILNYIEIIRGDGYGKETFITKRMLKELEEAIDLYEYSYYAYMGHDDKVASEYAIDSYEKFIELQDDNPEKYEGLDILFQFYYREALSNYWLASSCMVDITSHKYEYYHHPMDCEVYSDNGTENLTELYEVMVLGVVNYSTKYKS